MGTVDNLNVVRVPAWAQLPLLWSGKVLWPGGSSPSESREEHFIRQNWELTAYKGNRWDAEGSIHKNLLLLWNQNFILIFPSWYSVCNEIKYVSYISCSGVRGLRTHKENWAKNFPLQPFPCKNILFENSASFLQQVRYHLLTLPLLPSFPFFHNT